MNIEFNFSQPGQMYFTQNRVAKMQEAYKGVQSALAGLMGNKAIISGVQLINGTVSDGWVSYNGEVLPFVGGSLAAYVDVQETITPIPFGDNTSKPVLKERKLVLVTIATGSAFLFSDLVRTPQYKNVWNAGNIKQHKCDAAWITANFDTTTWEALPSSSEYGWKIDLDAGGRVIVGWHPADSQPIGDDAWSTEVHTIGRKFGERLHQLTQQELPSITWNNAARSAPQSGNTTQCLVPTPTPGGNNATFQITLPGGNQAHNNIQPSIVYLTLEKL